MSLVLCFAASVSAFAGDLVVTTAAPVAVFVDGVQRPFVPGTMTVSVPQLAGTHRVDLVAQTGQLVGAQLVDVPPVGLAQVTFDGANLYVQVQAGGWQPQAGQVAVQVGMQPMGMMVQPVAVQVQPAAPAPAPGPVAMDDGAFRRLMASVNGASFADGKLAAVGAAARGNWFTIAQVAQLLGSFSFGSDRIEAVRICAPKVVDPQNAFDLGPAFTFDSDREEAMALFQ